MPHNPIFEGIRGPGPRDYLDQVDNPIIQHRRAWILTLSSCGDVTPLIDHISQRWNIELIEERYPGDKLYYVH
jgi:hypothetical protein